ncbi:MAG: type II toxin-antitoxin system VapC family toxin [Chloroflexi bacterium]|nr:type II toxin-antitoxin system VapC family toxin [Chloroflexota bacterium]
MIFVDTNVFMYAVGTRHYLRQPAIDFFAKAKGENTRLATSAEVIQELLHVYLPVARIYRFNAAVELIEDYQIEIWPLDNQDVILAAQLHDSYPALSARDLCHLASCRRRGANDLMTFDQSLRVAFDTFS